MKPLDLQRKSTISGEGVRSSKAGVPGPQKSGGDVGQPDMGRALPRPAPGSYAISNEGVRSRGQSIKRCGRRSREATPGSVTALPRVQKSVVVQELATARAQLDRQQIDGQQIDLHTTSINNEGVRSTDAEGSIW